MTEQQEEMGSLIDRLENVTAMLVVPLPDKIHVDCLRESLPEITEKLKKAFVELTGENPWR